MSTRLDLLLHPVRLRLVHALSVAGALTTAELGARLPDQPKASIYRQVERLVQGGVFEVESTRQVRGAVERRYRLVPGGASIDADTARSMSLEDHRRGFTASMAALIAEFSSYLDRRGAEPTADEVSYRQYTFWLSPAERAKLVRDVGPALRTLMENKPSPGRAPYRLSTIFFPAGDAQPTSGDEPPR
jgi:hypothetical protein